MGQENVALVAFNRGIVSRLALARTDVKRVAFSADTMVNWIARVMGSMMLRPGLGYLGATHDNSAARCLPFVFATSDTALVELTDVTARVWVEDELVTREDVATAVTNGDFDTDLSGWTDSDEGGGTSVWVTGGYMGLTGNGTAAAIRDQLVAVAGADLSVEHALDIVIQRGPVTLRVGSTSGGDEYIAETTLATGSHSLAFTPTGDFYIRFSSTLKRQVLVDSCNVAAAGVMAIEAPWLEADLGKIRFDQSGDVLFIACSGYQQHMIERRGVRSWSVVRYYANDGPLRFPNTGPITMTAAALSGNTTLTASRAFFKSSNVGSLFRVTSNGQNVTVSITAQNTFTNAIRVEGVDVQRVFSYTLSGISATGSTATLQRSLVGDSGPWTDVVTGLVADVTTTYDDNLDNQIAWYRFGVKTGGYAGGTITASLAYTVGSIDGYVRVTAFTSATVVDIEVLSDLGGITATDDWAEGEWSDRRGWPTSVAFYEGRLWWAGRQGIWGSVSDGFESFDEAVEGDSGPINRDVGAGPVDTVNWLLPVSRLIAGAEGAELSCKSSSLDEPLTPTNFQIKPASTQGSSAVGCVRIDKRGIYIQNGGTRVFELAFGKDGIDYDSEDLTVLVPEIGEPEIVRMAVQRKPDTRIHCVRSDGSVAVAIFDRAESVLGWQEVETRDGDEIEDVSVLPGATGTGEDAVYYVVARSINGSTARHLERWALESECRGSTLNKQADAFITYSQTASATIADLGHLEAEEVVVWDNGKCLRDSDGNIATFTVASASITVTNAGDAYQATEGVVGLAYEAQWRSTKLAYAGQGGTALTQRKKLEHLGVILVDTHYQGLKYGPTFDNLQPMPLVERGTITAVDTVHENYDEDPFEFGGEWSTDSRICLQANAPRPCNILAAVFPIEEHSKR